MNEENACRIGIDFDNTLAQYDALFAKIAKQTNLVDAIWQGTKQELRDHVRTLNEGELQWQRLQGQVYGKYMHQAELFHGVANFLLRCRLRKIPVFIVSHKTEFGHHDPEHIPLRTEALKWMTAQGFFDPKQFGILQENVYFESTRQDKVQRINKLECSHFIDDLIEVFEESVFLKNTQKILFSKTAHSKQFIDDTCDTWTDISQSILGEETNEDYHFWIQQLFSDRIQHCISWKGHGNSRLHQVQDQNGSFFAVKSYPDRLLDSRDRLGIESQAFSFLKKNGFTNVPSVIKTSQLLNLGVYEWIEGRPPCTPTEKQLEQLILFVQNLQKVSFAPEAHALSQASEACLSFQSLCQQIETRRKQFQEITEIPELSSFLKKTEVLWEEMTQWSSDLWPEENKTKDLPARHQTLSPSDFGFHNTLQYKDSTLYFIDFEYFGWDDPVKLIADFLWHPAMKLTKTQKKNWVQKMLFVFKQVPDIQLRLQAAWPLYGMRWIMILLNEFRKDGWKKRLHANSELRAKQNQRQQEQLQKANQLLTYLQQNYLEFPYV